MMCRAAYSENSEKAQMNTKIRFWLCHKIFYAFSNRLKY